MNFVYMFYGEGNYKKKYYFFINYLRLKNCICGLRNFVSDEVVF